MIQWTDYFLQYSEDIFHCLLCHRLVRTYDANDDSERIMMMQSHKDFNCRGRAWS